MRQGPRQGPLVFLLPSCRRFVRSGRPCRHGPGNGYREGGRGQHRAQVGGPRSGSGSLRLASLWNALVRLRGPRLQPTSACCPTWPGIRRAAFPHGSRRWTIALARVASTDDGPVNRVRRDQTVALCGTRLPGAAAADSRTSPIRRECSESPKNTRQGPTTLSTRTSSRLAGNEQPPRLGDSTPARLIAFPALATATRRGRRAACLRSSAWYPREGLNHSCPRPADRQP
jgi:hypothetical protein